MLSVSLYLPNSPLLPSPFQINISNIDRTRIIKAHLNGKKPKMIAEIMDVPQRRVEVIIRHYAKTGRISSAYKSPPTVTSSSSTYVAAASSSTSAVIPTSPTPSPPSPQLVLSTKPKITAEQIELLRIWTTEDAAQTGSELTQKLNDAFETNLSVNTVQRNLGTFLFSISRLYPPPPELKNDPRTLTLRKEFCQIYEQLPTLYSDAEVVYVGHMRFLLAVRDRAEERTRGRLRRRNMSILVAMTRATVVAYQGQNAPVDPETFKMFVERVVEDEQRQKREITTGVLIMDEGCLKSDEEGEALSEAMQEMEHTIIFLPPNSPFLNPLEGLFAEFRDLFGAAQAEPENETELVDYIASGERLMSVVDCSRYVEAVAEFLPKCVVESAVEIVNLQTIYAEVCEGEEGQEQVVEMEGV